MLRAVFPGLTAERIAHGFEFGGQPPDQCGPAGMVFAPDGEWIVANAGTGSLFRLSGTDVEVTDALNSDAAVADLAVSGDGRLFGSRKTEIVELDPSSGSVTRRVAAGFSELVGLVYDARSACLVAADFEADALYDVEPSSGATSVRVADPMLGNPNGISLDGDGRVLVAGYGSKHVLAVGRNGSVEDLGELPGWPDSVAAASPDGPLAGSVVVNQRDGTLVTLQPGGTITRLATDGTPGDLIGVDPEGRLVVTQLEEVWRIGPAWFGPQPWRALAQPLRPSGRAH